MRKLYVFLFFGTCALVAIVWGIALCVSEEKFKSDSLVTLFTGWAFAGAAFAFLQQWSDSRERDRERQLDYFEKRFYQMIESWRSLVRSFYVDDRINGIGDGLSGRDLLKNITYRVENRWASIILERKDPLQDTIVIYKETFDRFEAELGAYFRLLYHVFRLVDNSALENKQEYTDLLRAEISSPELKLLAFNALTENGAKFMPLVRRYHLLKHMTEIKIEGVLEADAAVRRFIGPAAFED